MVHKQKRLNYGVGDRGGLPTLIIVDGKSVGCPYYLTWSNMLQRCYSEVYLKRNPTYAGCSVAEEWHYFPNFKCWMEKQMWEDHALDKDVLVEGNRVYSEDTCTFISRKLNSLMTDFRKDESLLPKGVYYHKAARNYVARCFTRSTEDSFRKTFTDPVEAGLAVLEQKKKVALRFAITENDPRVQKALIKRFTVQN